MHSMEYLCEHEHMAAVITLQSQFHEERGRSVSGERITRPWASTSADFGMKTVRLAPKPARRAAPCKQAWQEAKRHFAQYRQQSGTRLEANHVPQGQMRAWVTKFFEVIQSNIPNEIGRRRLNKSKHRFGAVIQNVGIGTACTENATPMLAESACCLIRMEGGRRRSKLHAW